jgi:cell division protein FtsL
MLAERVLPQVDYHEWLEPARAQQEQAEKERNRRPQATRLKRNTLYLAGALFIYALAMVALCLNGSMASYHINSLKSEIGQLETSNYRYEYQIQQLTSLDRIERIAIQELDMVKPEWSQAYMLLETGH